MLFIKNAQPFTPAAVKRRCTWLLIHQAVRMQAAPRPGKGAREMEEVERPVLVRKEADGAVIAALNGVDGSPGKHETRASRHAVSTSAAVLALT